MRNRILASSVLVLGLGTSAWCQGGPAGVYYLSAATQSTDFRLQGTTILNSWAQAAPDESALAVAGDVRSIGIGMESGTTGSQYTLSGSFTGVHYTNPFSDDFIYDGTTDGAFNYGVEYISGNVYRFSNTWSSPTLLFNTTPGMAHIGITYDPINDSLWVSQFSSNMVEDYAMNGALLSSFAVPFNSSTCLAMDHTDNTLWMGSQSTPGTFYHYSRGGTSLGSVTIGALANMNTLGGEFQLVPEPLSLFALGAGAALLMRRRR